MKDIPDNKAFYPCADDRAKSHLKWAEALRIRVVFGIRELLRRFWLLLGSKSNEESILFMVYQPYELTLFLINTSKNYLKTMIKIYHNNMCSKSRAALNLLKVNNEEIEVQEYLKVVPTKSELKEILKMLQMKPLELIRKNETLFKENYKDKNLSDEEWIDIMLENPVLIERPIVVKDGKAAIGRPIEKIIELLNN
ncbi:arsenate reductase (glutaredoxin) [Sphingobacterium mizutaii]|uniref:arsenate reductase (glutaredoxin) n=2 Tax=Sphingobacterium TaxID=28453 RepID=UPI0028ACBD6E|nr:arsenate reductase (glutaredoxin) [Sphingobacterium mizutaii]